MARMAKVNYKNEKIPVSVSTAEKQEIEDDAANLGISPPALFRLLYKLFKKGGKNIRVEEI